MTYIPTGIGSTHSNIPFSAWQRHTPQCDARGNVTKRTGTACKKCRASDATQEMRFYALLTSVFLTGESVHVNGKAVPIRRLATMTREQLAGATFVCPLTLRRIAIRDGQADRIVPGAMGGRYVPGNIALTAADANLAREQYGHNVEAYAADVMAASERVMSVYGVPEGVDMPSGWRAVSTGRATRALAGVPNVLADGPYGV